MLGTVRNRQLDAEEAAAKKLKAENKEKLIDELMFSDADAGAIVSMHEKEMEVTEQASRAPKFSTGIAAQNMASGMEDFTVSLKRVCPRVHDHVSWLPLVP